MARHKKNDFFISKFLFLQLLYPGLGRQRHPSPNQTQRAAKNDMNIQSPKKPALIKTSYIEDLL
jgi:hypothetical protein